jgi:hypothetical protein
MPSFGALQPAKIFSFKERRFLKDRTVHTSHRFNRPIPPVAGLACPADFAGTHRAP